MSEIYQHRVYRELQAASRIITSENIVRYFNSWFEELDSGDKLAEAEYKQNYIEVLRQKQASAQKKKPKRNLDLEMNSGGEPF